MVQISFTVDFHPFTGGIADYHSGEWSIQRYISPVQSLHTRPNAASCYIPLFFGLSLITATRMRISMCLTNPSFNGSAGPPKPLTKRSHRPAYCEKAYFYNTEVKNGTV